MDLKKAIFGVVVIVSPDSGWSDSLKVWWFIRAMGGGDEVCVCRGARS